MVGLIYLAALIFGFGAIAIQLLSSGDSDGDAGGHDADADADADASGDADGDGHSHGETGGFLPIVLSLRFWTFSFLAFGLSGTLLHFLQLANRGLTLGVALGVGLCSGLAAAWVFNALKRAQTTSGSHARDAVGLVGKVLVPCSKGGRGKVRLELRGQTQDFTVTTDDERIEIGDLVLVEDIEDTRLKVSRAPREYLPARAASLDRP